MTLSNGTANLSVSALNDLRREVEKMNPKEREFVCSLEDIDRAIQELTAASR